MKGNEIPFQAIFAISKIFNQLSQSNKTHLKIILQCIKPWIFSKYDCNYLVIYSCIDLKSIKLSKYSYYSKYLLY